MNRRRFFFGLLLASMTSVAGVADKLATKTTAPSRITEKAIEQQVIVYYFHGTVRCETCQKIELLARDTIEKRFAAELTEKRLVFMPVNFDKTEYAHFLQDYKLPSPSLVVVWQKSGKDQKWKLLDKTWELIEHPVKFNEYVESEVGKFLRKAR